MPRWTRSEDITQQVQKCWDRGEILSAKITETPLFPLKLRLNHPSPREVANQFGEVQDWVQSLSSASKENRGFGFEICYETMRNRVQGTNDLPVATMIPTETDALRLIRRQSDADRFQELAVKTYNQFPILKEWLTHRALTALKHADYWNKVLAVLNRFVDEPRPDVYLRQLDIPGVDTKFVENHRRLLTELLDVILPENLIDHNAIGIKNFNQRYGLRTEPPLIRFRVLDPALYIQGLTDLSLTPEEFNTLQLPVQHVFITENQTNGLAFPNWPNSLVIFGLGYGIERLSDIMWLHAVPISYWGDIDTHGFGILNRMRAIFPNTRSFLMDRETLKAHRLFWGQEPADKRYAGEPSHLTPEEQALFNDLRDNCFGEHIRLEQEKVAYKWIIQALNRNP